MKYIGKTGENLNLGIYVAEIMEYPILGREEQITLARIAQGKQKGNRAQATDCLVKSNLRFVVSVAKRYRGCGLSIPDLIAEGNIGLLDAVPNFDTESGNTFLTYAKTRIEGYILHALSQQTRLIRLPAYQSQLLVKGRKLEENLPQRLGRMPRIEDRAKNLGLSEKKVRALDMLRILTSTPSLDHPYKNSPIPNTRRSFSNKLRDSIPDTSSNAQDEVLRKERREMVRKAMATLSPQERFVIEQRFGMNGEEPKTLKETGGELLRFRDSSWTDKTQKRWRGKRKGTLTRERPRQIQERALERLRNNKDIRSLDTKSAGPIARRKA